MDFIIEYGEYRAGVQHHHRTEREEAEPDREYISGCLGEPFRNITKILAELYEDVVLIFNNMFVPESETITNSRPETPTQEDLVQDPSSSAVPRAPTPQIMVDLSDMPTVTLGNREQYSSLIDYLQTKIVGMEITRAEQEINMVNPRVKLYTEMYNDVENVSVYVTIDDKGRITSIDKDGKIIAEFFVE